MSWGIRAQERDQMGPNPQAIYIQLLHIVVSMHGHRIYSSSIHTCIPSPHLSLFT